MTSPKTTSKKRILLLAGGRSGEHEVSLSSARSVLNALPKDQFEVTPLLISKEGKWLPSGESSLHLLEQNAIETGGEMVLSGVGHVGKFDVVFPVLHGPNGEDGTVQGLLTLAGLPFVGSGVLGSAVCMDKVMTKQVLTAVGIPQVEWRLLLRSSHTQNPDTAHNLALELGYPLFVKPANMGSSVGIHKVANAKELRPALEDAFSHDRRVILEKMVGSKPRELEVGILGNDHPEASVVGELSFQAEFYDYHTKYTPGEASEHIPANIPLEISEQIRAYALKAFKATDCAGLARIDFFYAPETGELYLNEINTMPGFTATSMYPKLWQASGIEYGELVSRLVDLALEER